MGIIICEILCFNNKKLVFHYYSDPITVQIVGNLEKGKSCLNYKKIVQFEVQKYAVLT